MMLYLDCVTVGWTMIIRGKYAGSINFTSSSFDSLLLVALIFQSPCQTNQITCMQVAQLSKLVAAHSVIFPFLSSNSPPRFGVVSSFLKHHLCATATTYCKPNTRNPIRIADYSLSLNFLVELYLHKFAKSTNLAASC